MAATRLFFAGMFIANAAANLLTGLIPTFIKNNVQITGSEVNKSIKHEKLANDGLVNDED